MSKLSKPIAAIALGTALGLAPVQAIIINLDLYNSVNLIDENNVQLLGTTSSGDLVQVFLTGAGDAIDSLDIYGNPSGNDTLLFTAYVGLGVPGNPNQGLVDVFPIPYDSALVGQYFYVRFWNDSSVGAATYYGNSSLFQLPAGDGFNQAILNFTPSGSSPHQTDNPFGALVIPEPSSLFFYGLGFLGLWWLRRRTAADAAA